MRAIVVDTDRSGLIHAGLRDWRGHEEELFGFCNCSAAYCYPIRAGIKLGMPKQYPRVHYMADRDPSLCDHCELCVERCQFGAFYSDTSWEAGSGSDDTVRFDPSKCWGCGLCANGCPEGAISMQALDA